jgi:Bacterial Ig-like domain (group 2)
MKNSSIILLFALALGLSIAACGSSTPAAPSPVSTVAVSGGAPAVGATAQFTAIATLANGATEDISSSAIWSSSDTTVATVSATGMVTSVASGAVVISATFSGVIGSDAITVP